ncbi:MAG TPA: ABC transporter ATP-binding protein [Dissulfurispiraceae bacterium]|nr:ABC transporter ATP-binding protein [Dissulfurispiraceae bacterium]
MLELREIKTSYGQIEALHGVDITVNAGEIVCLIGSNGAGKTTTLMTISGILRPKVGSVTFKEKIISSLSAHEIVGLGISHVPEGRRIFPRMTVMENLEMGGFMLDGASIEAGVERVFRLFPILKERQKQQGGTLSGGEQQMLAIARALMAGPQLLLLDEPSLGLAPIMVSKIFRTIHEINQTGVTVLLVEQNSRAALRLAHRGYVIENGCIAMQGTGSDLLHNEAVKKAYLGL